MGTDTKTDSDEGLRTVDLALRSLDDAIEKLVIQRKDVERRLVDLKAEDSVAEDEMRNSADAGKKMFNGNKANGSPEADAVEQYLRTLAESSHGFKTFLDTVIEKKIKLDQNREVEKVLEELRTYLSDTLDTMMNIKPLLMNGEGCVDEKQVRALTASRRQFELGKSAIIRSQEMERQRIAREIHDGPAQAIANVVLRLDIVRKIFDKNPDTALEEFGKMKEIAQGALNEIRGFIFDLRPMTLQDLGLTATIKRIINSMDGHASTEIHFIQDGDEREMNADVQLAVFRIAQESLNNMLKHAKAKECWVHLKYFKDKVILLVEDDGEGFDETKLVDPDRKYVSYGILGMRERADDIGASLDISSSPGEGTKVTLVVMDKSKGK